MIRKINIILCGIMVVSGMAYAECPGLISHDEARLIAQGEKNSSLLSQYEPIDMKNIVKKGTSKAYTGPKLILQQDLGIDNRWKCIYEYQGKVTKNNWQFSFSIPKNLHEIK